MVNLPISLSKVVTDIFGHATLMLCDNFLVSFIREGLERGGTVLFGTGICYSV